MSKHAVWRYEREYHADGKAYLRLTLRESPTHDLIWSAPVPMHDEEIHSYTHLLALMRATGWTVRDPPAQP